MPSRIAVLLSAALLSFGSASTAGAVEIQGHRGARGLAPENSLPAFEKALDLGVDVLELDTLLTKDGMVVIHHDPALSPNRARLNGDWITQEVPIRSLSANELAAYDIGRLRPGSPDARKFPEQQAIDGTEVPLLSTLFGLVARRGDDKVRFNIETKLSPERPGEAPPPAEFAAQVIDTARRAGMLDRVSLQSFDWSTLIAAKTIDPGIPTVCLTAQRRWLDNVQLGAPGPSPWLGGLDVDAHEGSVQKTARAAGCAVWSPYFKDVTGDSIAAAHAEGLKVVVWTVNSVSDMKRLIALGVDGIITDYPDRAAGF